MNATTPRDALPRNFELHWYRIDGVLGQGGFGITYLAHDTNLDQAVAIKEYLPVEYAMRVNEYTVAPRTDSQDERYHWGLERFIIEARTLARFDHHNIVRVHSVFEFNGTAYMMMRYESGESLDAVLDRQKTLEEKALLDLLFPILDGLAAVHAAGFIHRDIKPANIYIRDDGSPVLLDFGSARQAVGRSKTLTILIAPGYAPFEQYYSSGESQGPWSDIYSLGATLYRAIASVPPIDAIERSKGILGSTRDVLIPATLIGKERYSESLLQAVDHALKFSETERPQSIAEWLKEFDLDRPVAVVETPAEPVKSSESAPPQALAAAPRSEVDLPPDDSPSREGPPGAGDKRAGVLHFRWILALAVGVGLGFVLSLYPYQGPVSDPEEQELQAKIASLENRLQQASDKISERETRLQDIDSQLTQQEQSLQDVSRKLKEGERRVNELATQAAVGEEEIRALNKTKLLNESLLNERNVALAALREKETSLARRAEEQETYLAQLEEERQTLERASEDNQGILTQLKDQITALTKNRDQLTADVLALTEQSLVLEEKTDSQTDLNDPVSQLQSDIDELEGTRQSAQRQIDELENRKRALNEELTELSEKLTEETAQLSSVTKKRLAQENELREKPADSVPADNTSGEPVDINELTRAQQLIASGELTQAMDLLQPLATQCNANAQLMLAELYYDGSEPFKAYYWYRAAEISAGADTTAQLKAAGETLQPAETAQADRVAESNFRSCQN